MLGRSVPCPKRYRYLDLADATSPAKCSSLGFADTDSAVTVYLFHFKIAVRSEYSSLSASMGVGTLMLQQESFKIESYHPRLIARGFNT
jgi:hypothetical protein